ncbi:MAG: single-stranded DNA-binding protein [Candidatus Sericytochromatia bacterium]
MSLNFIVFSGHLVNDSEIRYTPAGKPVLEFSLSLPDGHEPEIQHAVRVISRRESAPEWQPRLKRGTPVVVEGQLIQRQLETSSGHRRKQPEIHMDHLTIMDPTSERNL